MNLIETIEREKWPRTTYYDEHLCSWPILIAHNAAILRILDAVSQPRAMKPWTDDCKPELNEHDDDYTKYWIKVETPTNYISIPISKVRLYNDNIIENSCAGRQITHWLELETTPILPT